MKALSGTLKAGLEDSISLMGRSVNKEKTNEGFKRDA